MTIIRSIDFKELFWWLLSICGWQNQSGSRISLLRQMMYKRLSPSVITFRHGDIISFPGIRELASGPTPDISDGSTVRGSARRAWEAHYLAVSQAIAGMGGNAQDALTQFAASVTEQPDDTSESARGRISLRQEDISQIRDMVAGETANGVIFYPENSNPDFRELATTNPPSARFPYPIQIVLHIINQGRADQQDMNQLALLSECDWTCLRIGAPEMLSQLRAMGIIPPTFEQIEPDPTPDISEAVASRKIKSSGKSVSVEDFIARIDAELEANKDDDNS